MTHRPYDDVMIMSDVNAWMSIQRLHAVLLALRVGGMVYNEQSNVLPYLALPYITIHYTKIHYTT